VCVCVCVRACVYVCVFMLALSPGIFAVIICVCICELHRQGCTTARNPECGFPFACGHFCQGVHVECIFMLRLSVVAKQDLLRSMDPIGQGS
jgi:hypothetical protein